MIKQKVPDSAFFSRVLRRLQLASAILSARPMRNELNNESLRKGVNGVVLAANSLAQLESNLLIPVVRQEEGLVFL